MDSYAHYYKGTFGVNSKLNFGRRIIDNNEAPDDVSESLNKFVKSNDYYLYIETSLYSDEYREFFTFISIDGELLIISKFTSKTSTTYDYRNTYFDFRVPVFYLELLGIAGDGFQCRCIDKLMESYSDMLARIRIKVKEDAKDKSANLISMNANKKMMVEEINGVREEVNIMIDNLNNMSINLETIYDELKKD